jgi:hypothetical protein
MEDNIQGLLDRFEQKNKQKEAFFAKNEELKEEYVKALNGMAGSDFGKYFLKVLVQYVDLFGFKEGMEARDMYMSKGKKQVYLEMIRPFLTKELRKEIEND